MLRLVITVRGREVAIVVHRYDNGARGDCAERRLEIAMVNCVVADVAVEPGPELRKQVVRIASEEKWLPERRHMLQVVPRSERPIGLGAVEGLRSTPSCIDRRESLKPVDRRAIIETVREYGIKFERAAQ